MRRYTLHEFDQAVAKLRTAVKQRRVVRITESHERFPEAPYYRCTTVCGEGEGKFTKTLAFTVVPVDKKGRYR